MKVNLINVNDSSFTSMVQDTIELSYHLQNINKNVYFIDWVPGNKDIIKLCKSLADDIPIIIFDRYCSISDNEFLWLNDRNTVLMEPAINHRNGFVFQPYWVDLNRIQVDYSSANNRPYDIGYKDKEFNDTTLTDLFVKATEDSFHVCVDAYIKQDSWGIIKTNNIVSSISDYNDYNFLMVCGGDHDIHRGIIPDIRNIVYNGTVPLLWHTHYMLHGLFNNLIIFNYNDLRYYSNMYHNIGNVFITDLIKNINMYLPEMAQDNFIQTIMNIFEKM